MGTWRGHMGLGQWWSGGFSYISHKFMGRIIQRPTSLLPSHHVGRHLFWFRSPVFFPFKAFLAQRSTFYLSISFQGWPYSEKTLKMRSPSLWKSFLIFSRANPILFIFQKGFQIITKLYRRLFFADSLGLASTFWQHWPFSSRETRSGGCDIKWQECLHRHTSLHRSPYPHVETGGGGGSTWYAQW